MSIAGALIFHFSRWNTSDPYSNLVGRWEITEMWKFSRGEALKSHVIEFAPDHWLVSCYKQKSDLLINYSRAKVTFDGKVLSYDPASKFVVSEISVNGDDLHFQDRYYDVESASFVEKSVVYHRLRRSFSWNP